MFLNRFLAAVICSSTVFSTIYAFSYQSQKVRGVNLGGWLVLEVFGISLFIPPKPLTDEYDVVHLQPWITPSIFDNTGDSRIVDEYTFGQYQSHDKALNTLKHHWDTWITESDFEAIAAAGCVFSLLEMGYNELIVYADLIMYDSQLDTGHLTCPVESLLFKANYLTSPRP